MAEIRVNSTGGVKLFDADDSHYAQIKAGTISSNTDVLELGSSAVVAGTKVDLNGQELILDADADTSITADTDDQIDVRIAGADDFQFTANTFTAQSGSSIVVPDGGLTFGSTAISSTAAELNILDGVTSTTAELNILDGVTSTASELNLLDGGTSVGSSITLADADGLVVNDGGTMKTIPASDVKTYTGGGNFIRTGNNESNDLGINGFMSSSYYNYIIYASITNTGTDNTFVNMRFRDDSNNVNTSNRNYSFIYTIGDGTTDYDAISQDTASGNTHKISVGDDINETYNYVINITNHQGNNIFYNYTATTENWTNGSSQSIKGGGKHYSDGTNITGIDFITNAGTSIAGKIACFAIKSS